jgi:hypothetical protein
MYSESGPAATMNGRQTQCIERFGRLFCSEDSVGAQAWAVGDSAEAPIRP